ncbi:GNAT family N-acetyltransferase [Parapedobacter sp. DT-150]|uniref:GNAT family N-acetyltransferase n=1 Tax=Parapedobacter sp. DT-150 TaxID=3396162 RepID=UPI003F1B692E
MHDSKMQAPQRTWAIKSFDDLSLTELYKILQLRQEVFILEQKCVYSDLDNKDQKSLHLMCWLGDTLAAYTRLIPWGVSYPDASSIGRVVVAQHFRGQRLGEELMRRSIEAVYVQYGNQTIKIGAQHHLKTFYNHLGFEQTSEPYMDAGILHLEMTLGFTPKSP